MQRITGSSAVDLGGGKLGFREEDLGSGIQGTIVTADWLNGVQEELMAVIEGAGLAPGVALNILARAIQSQKLNYAAAAGAANAITASLPIAPAAYSAGLVARIRIASTNTGAATLNLNGLGAIPIRTLGGAALEAGDIVAGMTAEFVYDAVSAVFVCANLFKGVGPFALARITTFTTSQTWTRPAGCRAIGLEVQGGGGAGGGASATSGSNLSQGGGGGAGGLVRKFIIGPAASYTATIGAGGTGVLGANGNDGGASSFGALSAGGGGGGFMLAAGTGQNGSYPGVGGSASGGDVNVPGSRGGRGTRFDGTNGFAGDGGDSPYGSGATGAGVASAGSDAYGYGAGGGGALSNSASTSAKAGGAGAPGIIIVSEYY